MESLLEQSWARFAALSAVFLVTVFSVLVFNAFVTRRVLIRRRVENVAAHKPVEMGSASLRTNAIASAWTRMIDTIERSGFSLADSKPEGLRAKMIAAGYPSPYAPRWYTLIRLVMTLGLPAIIVGFSLTSDDPPSFFRLYIYGGMSALIGLYLPSVWIAARADGRQRQIINGFPDALDLMLVCVEAGLGLEAAFDRVGREMSISHPLVSQMLGGVVHELRAGRSRDEALRRMADGIQVDEIRSFSTLLIQSDKLGSSIGKALRIYTTEMREKRRMRAEEKAHRLPVLLSIPLVVCMLPVMIGVLMLPAAIRVVRVLVPALSGGG